MGPHYSAAGIPQSSADQEAKVRWHFECTEIFESPGESVGMLKVLRAPQEWRLIQIQILASHRGSGIGRSLVDMVVKEAKAERVSLSLSVLKVSPARRLYERAGFVVTSENENVFHMHRTD
jgi:ribosomal protein S18 acetylase RimI-like enzyme